jgi:flagellar P-ring protein precursor FlgI
MKSRIISIFLLVFLVCTTSTLAQVRIKDVSTIKTADELPLIGYGLVVGLDGTGDGKGTIFTVQSLVNMMQRMGISVPPEKVKVKNIAAVMVTAKISPLLKKGNGIDVTISSLGDASSLQGGTLLLTPLFSPDGTEYARAQGPVSIGGFNVSVEEGSKIISNYTLVGRIPNGAIIEKEFETVHPDLKTVTLSLANPDFTTAFRMSEAINQKVGKVASPIDEGTVLVNVPEDKQLSTNYVGFISQIEGITFEPDEIAKIVINEKTGTIVAGGNVTIAPVALAHGNLNIEIKAKPVISQPAPFSKGETVLTRESEISVDAEKARVVVWKETANISDVASALNAIGATPRDIIAIFQALKQAGALRAELIIL